ncbi:MAG TPA: chemotaxis protein CheB [Polyangia bacterium]|nr:chemotaxis protein CheB [Polyangia bacterium]
MVIACSAGGLAALFDVLASLDPDFPAAIVIVQHRGRQFAELLPALLQNRTVLRVRHVQDGDLLEAGTVYICPPGKHLTAEHCLRLVNGPKLDFVQPSADLMFRSVADAYGPRAVGVVLSGTGSDGTLGCRLIAEAGGKVLVQDPRSCAHAAMPSAAIGGGHVDLVLPPIEIGASLRRIVDELSGKRTLTKAPRAPSTTVVLVDDHRIILDGLRTLLHNEDDIQVLADAQDGHTAVKLSAQLSPDVVVMDVAMPDLDGVAATREIKARNPKTAVVALSARTDQRTAARILKAGATGYVSKEDAFAELAIAIRAVAARQPYFSPRVASFIAPTPSV